MKWNELFNTVNLINMRILKKKLTCNSNNVILELNNKLGQVFAFYTVNTEIDCWNQVVTFSFQQKNN